MLGRGESPHRCPEKRYRVGVVGAGNIAEIAHLPILDELPDVEIAYLADIDGQKARRLGRFYGAQPIELGGEMSTVPDCDVALLSVPPGVRPEYVQEFARRRTPVFAEKPFVLDSATHRDLLESHDRMICNYCRTKYGSTRRLRQLIETRLFGDVQGAVVTESDFGATGVGAGSYRTDPDMGGGLMPETSSHTFSQLAYAFGDRDVEVVDSDVIWSDGLDVDAEVTFEFGDDATVDYRASMVTPLDAQVVVEFDRARVRFDPTAADADLTVVPEADEGASFTLQPDDESATSWLGSIYLQWRAFLDALEAGTRVDAARLTGLTVTEMIDGAYANAERPRRTVA